MNPAKYVIAVGSCKGGVGKTTVSVNLAMVLRRLGYRVGIFDADLYGPNVPIMLGVRNRKNAIPYRLTGSGHDSVPYIPLYQADDSIEVEPLTRLGLKVVSLGLWFAERSVARDSAFVGAQLIRSLLTNANWGELDYLIIDLPPGTGELVGTVLSSVTLNGVLLVNTPQEMTLLDTGRSVELLQQLGHPILGRVENMSHLTCPECGTRIAVYSGLYDDWITLDQVPILGRLPLDAGFARPIDPDHPLTQRDLSSPEATTLVEIARNVQKSVGAEPAT